MYALTHCTLYLDDRPLSGHALRVDGDRILDWVPEAALDPRIPTLDCQGGHLAPGFIDLQLNGCGGVMFNDAITAETLAVMHRTNLGSGTTSFLPTLITTDDAAMKAAMALMADYRHSPRVLGLHLEGPYLNPKRKGIHDGRYVRLPDGEMVDAIATAGPEVVRLITLAPEQVPAEVIAQLQTAGVRVACGHTDAAYDQAQAGFEAGITLATHLFNAMSPWQSRRPGTVGAVLHRPDIYAGIIADGHHVHFASVALAKQLKGDRLLWVSDATPPVGTAMESFIIGGQEVFYRDGRCVSAEGTLGGSALTLAEAVANGVRHCGIELAESLRMASLYPARAIGVDQRLGRIAPGYVANLVVLDQELTVVATIDGGEVHRFGTLPSQVPA